MTNAGLELSLPDEVRARVAAKAGSLKINRSEKIVGFCPSANMHKCWPHERFAELGNKLIKDGCTKILLFGSSSDKQKCRIIADAINSTSGSSMAIDMSGIFPCSRPQL